ncbi:MAG: hypothetical protein Q9163_001235 [Psora crenata]
MEVINEVKPTINGKAEAVPEDKVEAQPSISDDVGASKQSTGGEETAVKAEKSEKQVPISAHQRERGEDVSARVREGKRWNDRERPKHGQRDRSTPNKSFQRNNKFDPTSLPKSDDPVAIRKQVEFYFSDSNLLTDKFLFTKMEGHENLPVPLDVIHLFKRMRHFQPRSAVVSALKESTLVNLVNDDNDIQRKEPLPQGLVGKPMNEILRVHEDSSMARSIYAKGFGVEEASTQFDIEAFFANYGPTNSVRLRRHEDRTFKGSVFVEFDNEETAKNFLAVDPPPMYKGKKLELKSKKQYCDDKVEDINAGRARPKSLDGRDRKGGFRGGRRDNDHRDLDRYDDRDWRLRREDDAKKGFPDRRTGDSKGDSEDRRGSKRKGFGSSARGRGGRDGRGGRGRDRNAERRAREERSSSQEAEIKGTGPAVDKTEEAGAKDVEEAPAKDVHTTATVSDPAEVAVQPPESDTAAKKRAHEDDEHAAQQGAAKKVDIKDG